MVESGPRFWRGSGSRELTAQAQNTANNYTGTSTGSLLLGSNWSLTHFPSVTEDATFATLPGIRSFTEGNLTVGSLNVFATTGTYSIQTLTTTSTNSTLTLGGSGNLGNATSGATSGDLIFTRTNSTLNIFGASGSTGSGVLNVVLGQSGNFDSVNTLGGINISAVISDRGNGYSINKTGSGTLTLSGLNTYSGGTSISSGVVSVSNLGNTGAVSNIGTGTVTIGTGALRYTGAGVDEHRRGSYSPHPLV